MEVRTGKLLVATGFMMLFSGMAMLGTQTGSAQDKPTQQQILDALIPRSKSPAFAPLPSEGEAKSPDPKAEERAFIDGLRARPSRSLSIEQREMIAELTKGKPKIDVEINFDYKSAVLRPNSISILRTLGAALTQDELKGTVFLIAGHTDARGSSEYNQRLSERRAEAVKRRLVQQFNLPAAAVIAIGYGKSHLKNTAAPFAGENRRVQIVNTEVKQ